MKISKLILFAIFCSAFFSAGGFAQTAIVTRGSYLQMGTANSVTVRWRTDLPTNSRVEFGTTQGFLSQTVDNFNLTTEHEIRLTNLNAGTKYFYSIGSTTQILNGNDANHFFVTSPALGQTAPARIWVLGDSGTADINARAVRNAYLNYNGAAYTNLLLMLGDNAYNNGTDAEYQAAVFNMYPTILRQTPLWSTIGNHETAQSTNPPSSLPYFQMFTFPAAAEAGGIASGTEKYYSFDYGNIHFVCLDSMTSSRAPGSAMLAWLQNDLAQNLQPWTIAFWHHPPYTRGSHNSDSEIELIEMRQNILPILEAYDVDLVLTGHSHSYERSFLINGHYGASWTFTDAMKKNAGGGREDVDGAYKKPAAPNVHFPNQGAVYAVAGSSGKISGGALNHPAMFVSLNNLGSMILDVNDKRLDAKFLRENGAIADYFTIIKGISPTAASVTVGGQITVSTSAKRGVAGAIVTMNDSSGKIRTAISNQLGFYQFADVSVGQNYIFSVRHKRYQFEPQILPVNEERSDINFAVSPSILK